MAMRRTLVALCAASLAVTASAFAPGAAVLVRGPARAHVAPMALRMAGPQEKGGFGKPGKGGTQSTKPGKSKLSTERKDAAARCAARRYSSRIPAAWPPLLSSLLGTAPHGTRLPLGGREAEGSAPRVRISLSVASIAQWSGACPSRSLRHGF